MTLLVRLGLRRAEVANLTLEDIDWRAGELGILAAALVIAVAAVTSVGFFADRVGQALERDAHQLLGADLVLVADHPWDGRVFDLVRSAGAGAEAASFISMALRDGRSQLAGVKLMGLPVDYLEKYTSRVRAVSPERIRAVAEKYMDPERAAMVVVGDASKIGKQLEALGKVAVEKVHD